MAERDTPGYDVGFAKPPQATRFRAGQSGNPKGRPKGSKNLATITEEELNTRITVTENGRRKAITKRQALVKQVVNKAVSGDLKAIGPLMNMLGNQDPQSGAAVTADTFATTEDKLVMADIVQRIRATEPLDPAPQVNVARPTADDTTITSNEEESRPDREGVPA